MLKTRKDILWGILAFLLALLPILQHYKGFLVDARASAMIICLPFLLYKFWVKNRVDWMLVAPLMLFSIYKAFHGGFNILAICREGLFCFFVLAVANKLIDLNKFKKAIVFVAIIASFLIIAQYVCYYLLDFHFKYVPTSLFLEDTEQWLGMAETGRVSIKGNWMSLYRPSSLFLEPSHMALYCIPAIPLLLIAPNMTFFRFVASFIITIGVCASTSGIGIVICFGFWFLYFAFYCCKDSNKKEIGFWKFKIKELTFKDFKFKGFSLLDFKKKEFTIKGLSFGPYNILFLSLLVIFVVVFYFTVEVFRSSVNRIIFSENGYNAILGRTDSGFKALQALNGFEWIIGKTTPSPEGSWYMSAFHATIFDYGLIGFVLSYVFYIRALFRLSREYFWITAMIIGLSFFSIHTHGPSYMLYYCMILLSGYFTKYENNESKFPIQIHPPKLIKC